MYFGIFHPYQWRIWKIEKGVSKNIKQGRGLCIQKLEGIFIVTGLSWQF